MSASATAVKCQAHEMHRIRRNQAARRNGLPAASVTLPGSIATSTRSESARAPSRFSWTRHLLPLLARPCYRRLAGHPTVLAGFGRSSGPVMNSVASRCARRGASGDHDQTKPLTPQPPFKTSRADLQLRRAAGARTPLSPAQERPSRWPGLWSAWLRAPYPHCARASDQPRLQVDGAGLRQPGPGRSRSATFQLDESFTCSIDRTGIEFSSCCSMGFDPISSNHH